MAKEEKVVRYTLTRADLFAFNFHGLRRNRLFQIMLVVAVLVFVYLGFNTPTPPGHAQLPLAAKAVAALLMGLIMLGGMLGVMFVYLILVVRTGNFKNLLSEHELRLTEEGMLARSANSEMMRKWTGLLKIVGTKKYLFLYVNETTAQIVPKRYFVSPEEARSFEQMIREQMKAD